MAFVNLFFYQDEEGDVLVLMEFLTAHGKKHGQASHYGWTERRAWFRPGPWMDPK